MTIMSSFVFPFQSPRSSSKAATASADVAALQRLRRGEQRWRALLQPFEAPAALAPGDAAPDFRLLAASGRGL